MTVTLHRRPTPQIARHVPSNPLPEIDGDVLQKMIDMAKQENKRMRRSERAPVAGFENVSSKTVSVVFEALSSDHSMTTQEVYEALTFSKTAIRRALRALLNAGKVVRGFAAHGQHNWQVKS